MSSIFQKNCNLYKKKSPITIERLERACPQSFIWKKCKTKEGEANLEREHDCLHSKYNAKGECSRYLDTSSIPKGVDVVCVYGAGLGYIYPHIKEGWLSKKKERLLILVEDDLEILHRLFEQESTTDLLNDPQVHLLYNPDRISNDGISEVIACLSLGLKVHLLALPYYARTREDTFFKFKEDFHYKALTVNFICSEFLHQSSAASRNLYKNLNRLDRTKIFSTPNSPFKNYPAIICGAGPSIEKQLPQLNELKDKALIFAGGSAVNALTSYGILPHFGGTVDPNEAQLDRMQKQHGYSVPFLFSSRTHREVLSKLHGELVYLPYEIGYYKIHTWIHEEFSITPIPSHDGISIPHVLMSIATLLGCAPIIFVGLDRAFTNKQLYTPGIIPENQLSKIDPSSSKFLKEKDINGEEALTKWEWVAEAKMQSKFVYKHSETQFINATEGGLPIEGAQLMSLKDASSKYLRRSFDAEAKVHYFIQSIIKPSLSKNKLTSFFKKVNKSLSHTIPLTELMLNHLTRLIESLNKSEEGKVSVLARSIKASRKKLEEEPAYKYILSPLSFAHFMILTRKFDALGREEDLLNLEEKCKISKEEVLFFRACAETNKLLLSEILPKA